SQVARLVHIVGSLRLCHLEPERSGCSQQQIKRAAGSKSMLLKEPSLQPARTNKVVSAIDSRTDDHIGLIQKAESLLQRLTWNLRTIAVERNHATVSTTDKNSKYRSQPGG